MQGHPNLAPHPLQKRCRDVLYPANTPLATTSLATALVLITFIRLSHRQRLYGNKQAMKTQQAADGHEIIAPARHCQSTRHQAHNASGRANGACITS